MVRMVQKDVYILYSDLPLKSRNNVMHPRYSSSMHSFGAMKVAFYKASLLRKRKLSIRARVNTNGPNGPKGRIHTI